MTKKTMISVAYDRIPQEVLYEAKIGVDEVISEDDQSKEVQVSRTEKSAMTMEEIVTELHELLRMYPDAGVTMLRGMARPTYFGKKNLRGFELDGSMRDLIRDDLEKAKMMFAPIGHTIKVRSTPPRVTIKE